VTLPSPVRVVGCGSPFGDDAVGWAVAVAVREALAGGPAAVEVYTLATPDRLLDALDGHGSLVLVDALESDAPAGSVTRFDWPDPRLARSAGPSSHGLSVTTMLDLAARLQRLPPRVVVYGIACRRCDPGAERAPAVDAAVATVARAILDEIGLGVAGATPGPELW